VAALLLASCGEKPEPKVPVPTATPTATATQSPSEPDQGDEQGTRVTIGIRVLKGSIRVEPRTVAAFLPLDFKVMNRSGQKALVRISGQPAMKIDAGLTASEPSKGEKPGRIRISAGGRHAFVRVKSGG
jgi:hypothetical protein